MVFQNVEMRVNKLYVGPIQIVFQLLMKEFVNAEMVMKATQMISPLDVDPSQYHAAVLQNAHKILIATVEYANVSSKYSFCFYNILIIMFIFQYSAIQIMNVVWQKIVSKVNAETCVKGLRVVE